MHSITNLPMHRIGEEAVENRSLEAVIVSFLITMLPHFAHLPIWVSSIALFAMIWRILQARIGLWPAPKWLLVPLVMVGGVSVFAQYWTIVGREPGLALLTVMTSFKFLETRTHRDVLILLFLCYFLLAMHFLFSQSIQIAAYMLLVLVIISATLISINQRDEDSSLLDRLKISSRLIALSIPIMIVLFVLVPRIPGPLWGLTQEQRGGVTGLSETMSPGQISNLISSNEVAFRVNFDGEIPAQQQLYWRGPVMAAFNGNTWFQLRFKDLADDPRQPLSATSNPVSYTVTLEPHGKNWLFGLDIPATTIDDSYLSPELQLTSKKAVNDLKRYSMESYLKYQLGVEESFDYLMRTSEFSTDKNPRTRQLGEQWARQFNDDRQIVNHALAMFRNEPFVYTLRPPLLGDNPSDEFLFDSRRGFCEHYASSFALLMRAAGIPARVVTGYQGGEVNELGGHLIVRQSDAHAWTEVWLESRGWVRIDPTAAVSPDRIENGLDQALSDELVTFRINRQNPLISQLLYGWDNLQNKWNTWVLNYNQNRQKNFLRDLGIGIRGWGDMIIYLVLIMIMIMGLYGFIGWYRERPRAPRDFDRIIAPVLKSLARAGYPRQPSEDLVEFAARIQQASQRQDKKLAKLCETYNRIKYAAGYDRAPVLASFSKMCMDWSAETKRRPWPTAV
jgi:transglutaminase-like putative cysteine protease